MKQERHNYEYQVDIDEDGAPARVVRLVGKDKRVMEVGAGPGSITRLLTSLSNCRVTALEIDSEAIKKLAPFCERVYQVDLNDKAWSGTIEGDERFEVIVAADVLEHVYEPLTVLKAMRGFLNEGGYMVISIPHVGHSGVHACLLEEDFEYSDFGLLDRTHIRFFGIKNIQKLFEDAGMKIVHAEFVVRNPEHTEFANQWSKLTPEIRNALASNPYGSVYQVVVKAVRADAAGEALSLMSLSVKSSAPTLRDSVRGVLRSCLSTKAYSTLRQIAAKLGVNFKG
jgi:2-polyprenyl-3-methyl-5-hydroxy-6-metoxy-1,4-benzoquinol methylase